MKIDSSVSVAMAMAQQYLRQHEVYMTQVTHRMNNQGDEDKDITLTVRLGEHELQKHSTIAQGDDTSLLMIDSVLNTITTSLLNMRDNLLQTIVEAEDTQKTNTTLSDALQHQKKTISDYAYGTASDTLSNLRDIPSQHERNVVSNSADAPLDMGHTALSSINAALQQISKSKAALHNMYLQANISSSSLSSLPIMNGAAAKKQSEQTKVQILGETNKSMQSQSNQNPTVLYSLL